MNLVATVREHSKRTATFDGKSREIVSIVLLDNAPAGECLNQFPEYELDAEQQKAFPIPSLTGKTVNISISKVAGIFNGTPRFQGRLVVVNK